MYILIRHSVDTLQGVGYSRAHFFSFLHTPSFSQKKRRVQPRYSIRVVGLGSWKYIKLLRLFESLAKGTT